MCQRYGDAEKAMEQVLKLDEDCAEAGGAARAGADDVNAVGPAEVVLPAARRFSEEVHQRCGLTLQWNKSKARSKRSPSPFGLTLTADIRTHHISSQGWSVPGYPQHFPAQTPVRWFPVPGLYQHHPGHHAGVGPLLHHGGRFGRSVLDEDIL